MPTRYSGHVPGQSDSLHPDQGTVWDWRLSSLQVSKQISIQQTLPGQPDTTSDGYGTEVITDNLPCTEVRTYTTDCITHAMLETLRAAIADRYAVITLTDRLGFFFTGRATGLAVAENGTGTEASAFYSASLTLRSIAGESSATVRHTHTLSDD